MGGTLSMQSRVVRWEAHSAQRIRGAKAARVRSTGKPLRSSELHADRKSGRIAMSERT